MFKIYILTGGLSVITALRSARTIIHILSFREKIAFGRTNIILLLAPNKRVLRRGEEPLKGSDIQNQSDKAFMMTTKGCLVVILH